MKLDPTQRFSNRVEDYVKYRPPYPSDAIDTIIREAGLSAGAVIADVGCGTGISSRPFLERGIRVVGIEPNAAMRAAAEAYLSAFPDFTAIDSAAERIYLEDDSVDAVLAAQAFHWFDQERTREEFRRILRPGGNIIVMWNERMLDANNFLRDYEDVLLKYSTDYSEIRHDRFGPETMGEFFEASFDQFSFKNVQSLDLAGFIGRATSSSYMPSADAPNYGDLQDSLKALFANYVENDRIEIFYDTRVYLSRI